MVHAAWVCAAVVLILQVGADVIFKVPEIVVRHAAAHKSVGTGRANVTITKSNNSDLPEGMEVRYEEYFIEHEISTADARKAAEELDVDSAAHKSVGTGRANVTITKSNNSDLPEGMEVRYEEYFIEHEISTADARKAAEELDVDSVPPTLVGCGSCSRRELEYCETRLLGDHCCCERRAFPEPFPWLPHTCYMGPSRCQPLAHDCARYARLRDCCCHRKLAERWKSILASSSRIEVKSSLILLSILVLVTTL